MFLVKFKRKISLSFVFSLILHLCFLNFVVKTPEKEFQIPKIDKKTVQKISLEEIKFIKKSEVERIKQQIVETEQKGNLSRPDEKEKVFMGKTDQFYDRQTIARNNNQFKEGERSQAVSASKQMANVKPASNGSKEQSKSKLKLSLSELGQLNQGSFQEEVKVADTELAKSVGKNSNTVSSSNDFVEDIPLGDFTHLNTTEYKYFGFYQRIKQKLEQHWGATIQEKAKRLYRTGRRLPASDNLITAIAVILDDKGKVIDIKIEGSSGIRELDQAAIESFNKAGPFPNPPKGLVVDGRAIIQWGFVVKS